MLHKEDAKGAELKACRPRFAPTAGVRQAYCREEASEVVRVSVGQAAPKVRLQRDTLKTAALRARASARGVR